MTERKEKEECFSEFEISLPRAPKKAKDKQAIFNKFFSLIQDSKESLPVKIKVNKRRKGIILDSDEFMFTISFRKTPSIKLLVYAPEKNIPSVNEVANKVVNFMNTVLGESAAGSSVMSYKTILYPEKTINLAKKVIGEGIVAKINEEAKETLSPIGVFFEYTKASKEFGFATYSNEKSAEMLASNTTYKDKLPFNLIQTEYGELAEPAKVMRKIAEMEL